jgi:signal transduction histidine kinase
MADKRKGEFLASMSHEVRNPVSVIVGLSELLNLRIKDPKEKEYINGIMVNGRNLLKLLNDILDLSKIDAGKTILHIQKIDLGSFLGEFEQIYGMQFKNKNISFILKRHPDLPQNIWTDEVRLRQILMNIIGNSEKFTYEGYVALEAKFLKVSNEYGDMCFEISDSGIGISQENIEKLFEAFSQNPNQDRKYGGTGLGLSISKKLVELMGGHISVQSTQGVGTKVSITLHGIKYSDTARN